jgi:tetratricopeptide (TPR) repeat protein
LIKIGTVLREQNQLTPAKSAFEAAIQQLSSKNQARIYNRATLGLAETEFYLGDIEQSRSVMLSILSQALAQVDVPLVTQARLAIARTYAHEQLWQPTIEHAEAGLEELKNRVDLVSEARFHSLIARAYQALEDYAGAFSALSRQNNLKLLS